MKLNQSTEPKVLGTVLFIIVGACALLLSVVYLYTEPIIAENARINEADKLRSIFDSDSFSLTNNYYICRKDRRINGYIFKQSSKGYGGDIDMLVGIDLKGSIAGIEILKQSETPGLGTKVAEISPGEKRPFYLAKYLKRTGSDFASVEAITGATISSTAVKDGIKKAFEDHSKLK